MNSSTPTIDEPSPVSDESTIATEAAGADPRDPPTTDGEQPNRGDDRQPGIDANPVTPPNPLDSSPPALVPPSSTASVSKVIPIGSTPASRGKGKKQPPSCSPPVADLAAPTDEELARARMVSLRSEPIVRAAGTSEAARASAMATVAEAVAVRHPPRGDVGVHLSVREMRSGDGGEILVDPDELIEVLEELGRDAVSAGIHDVQVASSWKPRCGLDDVHSAFVLDIDEEVTDVEAAVREAGVPPPTFWWRSPRGVKVGYLFEKAVSRPYFDVVAETLTLAFEGADLSSLRPSQHQRLAHVDREDEDGSIRELREPVLAFGPRLAAEAFVPSLPSRLARLLLADDAPACVDQESILAYLVTRNIAPPDTVSVLQRCCPLCEHSAKKCYVHPLDHVGHVIHCLGDHEGAGPQTWTLARLAREAAAAGFGGGSASPASATVSSRAPTLGSVPLTWIALEYMRFHLSRALTGRVLEVAERVSLRALVAEHLRYAKKLERLPASLRADALPQLECAVDMVRHQHAATAGDGGIPAIMPAWDMSAQQLVSVTGTYAFQSGLERSPKKEIDLLVLRAVRTTAHFYVEDEEDGNSELRATLACVSDAEANLHRLAWRDDPAVRRAFGVPEVRFEAYPIAFCESGFAYSSEGPLKYTRVPDGSGACVEDPVEFFVRLFHEGKTPFASENDARLGAAVLAAPLFRELMQGRMPCAILTGPSGSGKNLLAESITAAWSAAGSPAAPTDCYLTAESASPNEFRLTVATMGRRIILRLPEVAKTGVAQEVVIKSERHTLFGRAHYGDPIEVPHRFLFIGDTLEGLPIKFEYERRIIVIRLVKNEHLTPTAFIDVFRTHGAALIEGFRRMAEARGPDFFRSRKSPDGRSPLAHALAEMCGATLTEVRGAELSEFWDAMVDLIRGQTIEERGHSETVRLPLPDKRPKDGFLPGIFGTYSLDELCEKAKRLPEHAETFRRINPNTVRNQLASEKAPHFEEVELGKAKAKVLFVLARDTWHVFGLARNGKRFFFVEPERVIAELRSCGQGTNAFETAWTRAKVRARNADEDLAEQDVVTAQLRSDFVRLLHEVRKEAAPDAWSRDDLTAAAIAAGVLPRDFLQRAPDERAAVLQDVIDSFDPATSGCWHAEVAS